MFQAEADGLLTASIHIDMQNSVGGQSYFEEIKQLYYRVRKQSFLVLNFVFSLVENNGPVGRAVTRSTLERLVSGSNLWPVKSDQCCQRLPISS